MKNCSVLVATYNHPEFLRRTLLGLSRQSAGDFEVLICDDGSGVEIGKLVDEFEKVFPGGITHVYQEDRGFRKCAILNEGILRAESDYLVFLDADCIPHRLFIEEHLACRQKGVFLAGRRVELGGAITARLDDDYILSGRLEKIWLRGLASLACSGVRHLEFGIYIPEPFRLRRDNGNTALLGCNFSCWKEDMYAINGFDESFESPGCGEDTDVERRFRMKGLRSRSVKNAAICYHQYHQLVEGRDKSDGILERRQEENKAFCDRGLKEHNG